MSKQLQALLSLGKEKFMSANRQELGKISGALNADGTVNAGRVSNLLKQVAESTHAWKHPSLRENKTNTAIEHKISQALSANFVSGWKLHMGIVEGMPELFSSEVPEKVISEDARDWLQHALLADTPNQFVLSCSMAERSIEADFRIMGVESKAMRESRLAAEKVQRERDKETIANLEKKGFIIIGPDCSIPTGLVGSLNRGQLLLSSMADKDKKMEELKADHARLTKSIDKLSGNDLTESKAKLSAIESELAWSAERIRNDCQSVESISNKNYNDELSSMQTRLEVWTLKQKAAIEEIAKLANQAKGYADKVKPPTRQYSPEQEKSITGLMELLECRRDEAIATLKAKGKL